ncbi:MAG: bifunctional UDP-N-acetylglucosamine diphosphorylase/glucosamine-1-phosphate N-acetyltransferase GlmU [Anaeromyxobacter sp.]
MASTQPLAAVVLAAGKGTRMRSNRAKVLHEAAGRPLAYFPVSRALEAGAAPVVVVVGHQAEAVEAALTAVLPGAPLRFALQTEQLGTAHAVRSAQAALEGHRGRVLILSGDTPLLTTATVQAVLAGLDGGAKLSMGTMRLPDPRGYGRIVRDAAGRAQRVVEEKDASPAERAIAEVNTGLYAVDAEFLWASLGKVGAANAQREYYLTDLVAMAAAAGGAATVEVPAEDASGVNDREELARAGRRLVRRIASALMRSGVTIEDPDRFDCHVDVAVGADTVIEPNVRLLEGTRVGAGCRVGAGTILYRTEVADGANLLPYTVARESVIGPAAKIGPFSHLRPGSEAGEQVELGAFVETKKAKLGKKTKAHHLSYLGDAELGAGVNVGAGTITCNYDGAAKHLTRIGDGAFIGSDSILVAPIEIGAGAYVAAGSTLTDPVPPGALALGRARQVVKDGWVEAHAPKKAPK